MKRWRRLRLAVMLCATVLTGRAAAGDYQERLMFADGLHAREMHDLALKEYAAILKAFPEGEANDAVTFRLAESLRLRGDSATAGRFYSHVVVNFRESPFRLRAAYRRARLYADEGDLESAIAHFRVILRETPPPGLAAATQYYLGETLLRKGGEEDAADLAFAAIAETGPESEFAVYALMKRGEVRRARWAELFKAEDPGARAVGAQAMLFFEQALVRQEVGPLAAEALFQMAEIHYRHGEFKQSAEYFRQLLARFPEDPRTRQARMQAAWSALNAGLYAESLAVAQAVLADDTQAATLDEWMYLKANSERQLLQHENSIRTYQALLNRFPASRLADAVRYEMAVAHYKAGVYDQAVREAEKIRMTPALRKDVCWLLAESYAALNMPAEATQYYRIVVRESEGSERARDALYRLAHQLQKQSSWHEASRFYLDLVMQYPQDPLAPQALFASAFCLTQTGAHDEAVRDWRRLAQDYADHELAEAALYQKAMGEVRQGRRSDATSTLVELGRRFPQSRFRADALYWQGMLLYEQEKYAEAEPMLRQAKEAANRDDLRREAMFQLGLVLQKLGRDEASAQMLQDLLTTPLVGKFPPALLEWMAAYHGGRQDFERMIQTAVRLAETGEPAWQQAGWVLAGRGHLACERPAQAETAFRSALATGAATHYAAEAALKLGNLALGREEGREAQRFFREASERATGPEALAIRVRSVFGLGHAAVLTGGIEDAARFFLSVAILYDDEELVPESLYRAADAFARLGRADERDKSVKELNERYPQSEWAEKASTAWPD